ncbi:DUF4190 domain-containing protein [Streptomyces sp. DT20]|uniref:DUF4190 domain-containing protein n=1 Tax=unclassified Streptomyces TaxID=2593676 RepID=UPI00093E5BF6|nr:MULTISPECIES: DUF4190 domain-containing protein [unclassified Streptomyces]OKK09154.1 hypothetical protein AMK09_35560 [Streptomyces sp. CB02488]
MSDNTEQPEDGAVSRDPWAPPDNRVPLDKKSTPDTRPPAVHDQQTVTAMPGVDGPQDAAPGPAPTAGFGPPADTGQPSGPYGPGAVPPPPVGPNGPGQQSPPTAGQYGYPVGPAQPPPGQYGYPAAPQYGGGYPGYSGQTAWGAGPANGMGTASMVLGILAVCLFCVYGIPSLVLGALALIFGIIGRKRASRGEADNGGQALAGLILGSIGIAIGVVIIGGLIWVFATHADEFDDNYNDGDTYGTSLVIEDAR